MEGLEKCWFSDFCRLKTHQCPTCQSQGLHYVVKRLHIHKSNIPIQYRYGEFSKLILPVSAERVREYYDGVFSLANSGKGIYLYSQTTGTGKTTIGCIYLIRYMAHFVINNPTNIDAFPSFYLNVSEYLEELRKNMNRGPEDEIRLKLEGLQEVLFDIDKAPRLMLFDDIGAERASEWVIERLYTLINFRVSNGLACIFTSNLSIPRIGETLGKRIESRISGCTKAVMLSGTDRRVEQEW